MARKLCTYCTFRPVTSGLLDNDICQACYDYQGAENAHNDEGHESGHGQHLDLCPICLGHPDPETTPPVKGHSNGIAKSHTSHAACKHPKTKKDRAICRKARDTK